MTKLRAGDGSLVGTYAVPIGQWGGLEGLAFDGANIWVTNYGGGGGNLVAKM